MVLILTQFFIHVSLLLIQKIWQLYLKHMINYLV